MKKDYTHISILLDRSGSMQSIKADVIGGINEFIEKQKQEPGDLTVSISQFDNEYDVINDFVAINAITPINDETFVPRGMTALLDSTAKIINDTGKKLAALSEDQRPEKVLVAIITDGAENASKEITNTKLAEMIKHQEETYNWQFIYIGANQDSFATGQTLGMAGGVNYSADTRGVKSLFRGFAAATTSYRSANVADVSSKVVLESLQASIDEDTKNDSSNLS